MAVDMMSFLHMEDHMAVKEVAEAGLKRMENLISLLSCQSHQRCGSGSDGRQPTDFTISKFKPAVPVTNRTGHARFRRAPANPPLSLSLSQPSSSSSSQSEPSNPVESAVLPHPVQPVTLDFAKPVVIKPSPKPCESTASQFSKDCFSVSAAMSSGNSSFISAITGDGSVSNGKQGSQILAAAVPTFSAGKPPLSSSHRKRCKEHVIPDEITGNHSLSGPCHCSKKRYVLSSRLSTLAEVYITG